MMIKFEFTTFLSPLHVDKPYAQMLELENLFFIDEPLNYIGKFILLF